MDTLFVEVCSDHVDLVSEMKIFGLVYTISDLLFVPDHFPESDTNNAPEYECLHEAWKTDQ